MTEFIPQISLTTSALKNVRLEKILGRFRAENRRSYFAAYLILIIWCFPLYGHFHTRGGIWVDWEWFLAYFQALHTTLLDFGQFPGFNPWMYLGTPIWGTPGIGPLTHFLPLVLLAGPLYGMKLGIVFTYFISFEGGLTLGRRLFNNPLAAIIGGLLYSLNTAMAAHWELGHVCFASYVLAPWLILFILDLPTRRWAGAAAGAIAGLMIQYGVHYFMIYALTLAGILTVATIIKHRAYRPGLRFGVQFILAALLVSATRLFPLLEVLHDTLPERLSPPWAVNWDAFESMFLIPSLGPIEDDWMQIVHANHLLRLSSMEFYAYAGMLVIALALFSLRWGIRFYHIGALISLALVLGNAYWWQPSRYLALIRPYDSMWVFTRWRILVLACLALAAAAGLDQIIDWTKRPHRRPWWPRLTRLAAWALPLELVILLFPSWADNVCNYREQPITRETLGLPQTSHMLSVIKVIKGGTEFSYYYSVFRSNVGVKAGYDPVFGYITQPSIRVAYGDRNYRGEYLIDDKPVTPDYWSPNRLRFSNLPPEAELRINLNPGRGWFNGAEPLFTDYKLFELNQLFTVIVPPSGSVDLNYVPPGLKKGFIVSLGAGLILLAMFLRERRRLPGHRTGQ